MGLRKKCPLWTPESAVIFVGQGCGFDESRAD